MLQRIVTEKYRNLDLSRAIDLSNIDIFVGSNGSGKTNLIDLITFIRDALTLPDSEAMGISKLEKAYFRSRKDFLDKWMRQDRRGMIRLEFYFDYPELHDRFSSEPKKLLLLSLVLFIDTKGNPHLSYESLASISENLLLTDQHSFYYQCSDHYNDLQSSPDKKGEVFVFTDNQKKTLEPVSLSKIPSDRLLLESITSVLETTDIAPSKAPIYAIRRFLIERISSWHFYNANVMNIQAIREAEPKAGQSDIYVSPSGENLALVLHNLINDSIDFEEEINRAAKAIRPDSQKIRTALTGLLSLTVQWKVSGIAEPFRLDELSDGTVRMLCWATILRSHKLPSLIVIEGPEVGIHPAWLKVLAEWIKLASERTQVIITTHSPDLLDCFTDRLENVYVFNQKQGDPHHFVIDKLSRDRFQSLLDEGWELGDIYRVGDPTLGGWPW